MKKLTVRVLFHGLRPFGSMKGNPKRGEGTPPDRDGLRDVTPPLPPPEPSESTDHPRQDRAWLSAWTAPTALVVALLLLVLLELSSQSYRQLQDADGRQQCEQSSSRLNWLAQLPDLPSDSKATSRALEAKATEIIDACKPRNMIGSNPPGSQPGADSSESVGLPGLAIWLVRFVHAPSSEGRLLGTLIRAVAYTLAIGGLALWALQLAAWVSPAHGALKPLVDWWKDLLNRPGSVDRSASSSGLSSVASTASSFLIPLVGVTPLVLGVALAITPEVRGPVGEVPLAFSPQVQAPESVPIPLKLQLVEPVSASLGLDLKLKPSLDSTEELGMAIRMAPKLSEPGRPVEIHLKPVTSCEGPGCTPCPAAGCAVVLNPKDYDRVTKAGEELLSWADKVTQNTEVVANHAEAIRAGMDRLEYDFFRAEAVLGELRQELEQGTWRPTR